MVEGDDIHLTQLGRFYVDLPIDIVYSRMIILSIIFGVYDQMLVLVAILSQHKIPFRR